MRILRIGEPGAERPAVLVDRGIAVDVSAVLGDIGPELLSDLPAGGLTRRLADAMSTGDLPRFDPSSVRVGPPLRPGKIVCVGLNYRRHAAEAAMPVPNEPVLFLKAADTVIGPYDDVMTPPGSTATDYEVELGVVIGKRARYLPDAASALDRVAGYVVVNDVSERHFQLERGGQWDKGKNFETFSPLGPWLVTADEVLDPQALQLSLRVNGQARQSSTTADMVFGVADLIHYISHCMTLHPGDVIATGTPEGVGIGFQPPRYLRGGDVMELTITGLGTQRQVVHEATPPATTTPFARTAVDGGAA